MTSNQAFFERSIPVFKEMQDTICKGLERCGQGSFKQDTWNRTDISGGHGGGGITRVMDRGPIFEKAGVNFSEVHGSLPAEMCEQMVDVREVLPFRAAGTSLVIHPFSPKVPTVHMNVRCLNVDRWTWFGGGIDLTPYELVESDCVEFHTKLKAVCDRHSPDYYRKFKAECDRYFFISHRGESRGVGGIFFDYLGREDQLNLGDYTAFAHDLARQFNDIYLPIVERHRDESFTEQEKRFQLLRRGRYVEFNLVYDRGTLFGLKTNGRVESILMSLPLHASWEYDYTPPVGSPEAALTEVLRHPREWA